VEYGVSQPIRIPKLADAAQWMGYYNDITLSSGGQLTYQPMTQENICQDTIRISILLWIGWI